MISCILLAAGSGKRMQCEANKIFLRLGPYSVLQWNLRHLAQVPNLTEVIIVIAEGEKEAIQKEVAGLTELPWQPVLVFGGAERQDSVIAGAQAVSDKAEIILVHDGARPMAKPALFTAVAEAAQQYGAASAAVPVVDTIKQVKSDQTVVRTLKRSELYAVQTPQGFRRAWLLEAQAYAHKTQFVGTDDVSLVEHQGKPVHIVNSDYTNCKLTTPADIVKAKQYLGVESMMRVGFGYDVHRFKAGRPCILGGVPIESEIGPDGHSDADVLIHAVMDALLGAAGLPDIGYWFPPEDEAFKGASSMDLLKQVVGTLHEKGFKAYNIDVMVIAEAPKLKPHINAIKANLASVIGIGEDFISVKATTHEKLGAFGRLEGLAAQAVATLYTL